MLAPSGQATGPVSAPCRLVRTGTGPGLRWGSSMSACLPRFCERLTQAGLADGWLLAALRGCWSFMAQSCHPDAVRSELVRRKLPRSQRLTYGWRNESQREFVSAAVAE